jgi:hypothetical protein
MFKSGWLYGKTGIRSTAENPLNGDTDILTLNSFAETNAKRENNCPN